MPNTFSRKWFEFFLDSQPEEKTSSQIAFIRRQLPLPKFRLVLDVPSGPGRHSGPLSALGHKVIAIDADSHALAAGEARWPDVDFRKLDMRQLSKLPGPVDGIICIWQSFGFFDAATNRKIFEEMTQLLRQGGRMLFDLYRRDFFQAREMRSVREHHGDKATSIARLEGRRLRVTIEYESGGSDLAEWEVFTPTELMELGERVGLSTVLTCTAFDEGTPATRATRDFQILFEKQ
jgi:SAM-dependent methyltransferase